MDLKGTKTEENLKAAFAGESKANRRYLYFANMADIEGAPEVANVFRNTAEGETGHAHGHMEYLINGGSGDPETGLAAGNVAEALESAIAVKLTSTPTCTRVWRKPLVTKASTKLLIGSKPG